MMHLLILDDEEDILQSFARVLDTLGHTCKTFTNAEQAVQAYHDEAFDVVITDYMMPGMNGLDVIQSLKQVDPKAFIIVITGYGSLEVALGSLGQGAYYYMTKPLDFTEMKIVLERINAEILMRKRLQAIRA